MLLITIFLLFFSQSVVGAENTRTKSDWRSLRSYDGAPPIIPHSINEGISSINCNSCHEKGGFAPSIGKHIPKTPHPTFRMCTQCHVPEKTHELFKENDFKEHQNIAIKQSKTLISAPPVIPHEPQLRQNCASCHTGPGAVKELKSSHPERVMCTQCHVFQQKKELLIIHENK